MIARIVDAGDAVTRAQAGDLVAVPFQIFLWPVSALSARHHR